MLSYMLQLSEGLQKVHSLCVSYSWTLSGAGGPSFDAPLCVIGQLVPRNVLE